MLTEKSQKLFTELAKDAGNWGGEPWLDGSASDCGNLTDLKKNGLVTSRAARDSAGGTFVTFTVAGKLFAKSLGIEV